MIYMKASNLERHLGSLKKTEVIFELDELPKTKKHPNTDQEKFHNILKHHIPTTYMSLQVAPRTITKRLAQLF